MVRSGWIQNLTPTQAWDEFVTLSVELFMSTSYREGFTDIAEACEVYVKDIPSASGRPFLQRQLNHIAKLLEQYIYDYVTKIGGLNELEIYTDEEQDELFRESVDDLMQAIEEFKYRRFTK